jgi:hypothetical protein
MQQICRFSLNYKYWENILGRRLKRDEVERIQNVRSEKDMNHSINIIYNNAVAHELYIPMLTPNDGNCLFSSLCYYNISDNIQSLKKGITNMMLFFKDMKNFIPGQEMTLGELFPLHNELEYVFCYNEQKLYKYTYDAMCIDIMADDGWKRINTELLLTVLSVSLNIKFNIFHDNGHITKICPNEKENTRNIFLAHVGECHYIPLDIISLDSDKKTPECIYYTESIDEFTRWAEETLMQNSNSDEMSDYDTNNNDDYTILNNI